MTNEIIKTVDLTKEFELKNKEETITALDNVNITIEKGERFGFLGPNGAGKTTLIKILTTLLTPTSGNAYIDGIDVTKHPRKAKAKVALMLESGMLYNRITAYDNLRFFSKIYNVPNYRKRIDELTEDFGLEKWLNQYVENFSSGMKMKLALCRTLLLDRDIMFLDEPTLGLDVKSISFIVERLKKSEKTIFLTSHDMNVVEKLCDRVAFINKGKILKVGKTTEISNLKKTDIDIILEVANSQEEELLSILREKQFVNQVDSLNNGINVNLKSREFYSDLIKILNDFEVLKITEQKYSLEDLFLKLIK
ncbi:MAG: ABC transporter ATP-binding protein [Promethearchaeia archaeon]